MKVSYNKNKNYFILRTETRFHPSVFANIEFIEKWEQVRQNKIVIPHTETNTGILRTLSGFEWSDLAFQSLYSVLDKEIDYKIKGLNHDLFAFQDSSVSFFFSNNGRGLCCHEMGLGKTIISLAWCTQKKRKTLIICPSSVKYNWQKEIIHWLKENKETFILNGRKIEKIPENLNYMIINYDILIHRSNDILNYDPEVIILDECFPKGTLINTPKGKIPIELLKEGDEVYNALGISTVKRTMNNPTKEKLLKVHLSTGKHIICTENHPFFTTKGWIKGKNLQNVNILLDINNIFDIIEHDSTLKEIIMGEVDERFETVRDRRMQKQSEKETQKILWEDMCSSSQKNSLDTTNDLRNVKEKTQRKSTKSNRQFNTYEIKQPNKKSRGHQKNKRALENTRTPHKKTTIKRWKWKRTTLCSTSFMGSIRIRMANRIFNIIKNKTKRTSNKLQSGYRKSRIKSLDRRQKFVRHEKGKKIKGIRVDRIEVLEPRNSKQFTGSTVYNIEVSGHPSYFAEDLLVHNCHYIKESSTKRTQAVKKICKGKKHIIGLSGTPIKSRPAEFFNMLHLINPTMFPSFWKFAHKYCGAKHNGFGWDFKGASRVEELNLLLEGIMIRRLKKDVMKDLPDKIRSTIPIELTNRKEYDYCNEYFLDWVKENKGEEKAISAGKAENLVKKGVLRRLAIDGKMKGIIEWLVDFLNDNPDEKIILFAIHKKVIDELRAHFDKIAVVIDGSTEVKKRLEIVEEFQKNKKIKMFIGNLQSAGTGITLTASSTVCFLEIDHLPNEYLQAEDRAHRIGQKDCVNVYYFLGMDTIDEEIMTEVLNPKMHVFNQVIDGKSHTDDNIFKTLMEGRK